MTSIISFFFWGATGIEPVAFRNSLPESERGGCGSCYFDEKRRMRKINE